MFVALGIQHAMRMRLIILASVTCTALHYFSTLSHKNDTIFEEKLTAYKMCFLIFSTTFA
jgi:ribosomal protein L33